MQIEPKVKRTNLSKGNLEQLIQQILNEFLDQTGSCSNLGYNNDLVTFGYIMMKLTKSKDKPLTSK